MGHHQTVLPSSFPSRRATLTCSEAVRTASRTFSRFSFGVAAVSKHHSRSGCLRGCSSEQASPSKGRWAQELVGYHAVCSLVPLGSAQR